MERPASLSPTFVGSLAGLFVRLLHLPRPGRAMAGKACSSAGNRAWLRQRGIMVIIPVKDDRKKHCRNRGAPRACAAVFDAGWYTKPNTVETSKPAMLS